jgi:hypothetical protein
MIINKNAGLKRFFLDSPCSEWPNTVMSDEGLRKRAFLSLAFASSCLNLFAHD